MGAPTLDRRAWLRAAAGAAAALAGGGATPARARPAAAGDFDAAVLSAPLYAPFKGVSDASGALDAPARLIGRWPDALRGRFYRNGPALFERNGQRYHHWFDGDGMVQQFSIAQGRVTHRGRLVRTDKLRRESEAGRFLRNTLGTSIEGGLVAGGPDAYNVANTNAIEHAGRVLALWEGGSAYALDVATLATEGPVTWRADLAQAPFSAHPKRDRDGSLWNFGTFGRHLLAWHIGADGALQRAQVAESPYPGGMVHDMALTERFIVLPLPPVKFHFERPVEGDGPRRFALESGQPLRIVVMKKDDIRDRRVFELPAEMVFHVGHAVETRDGAIELSYVGAADAWSLDRGAVGAMAARPEAGGHTLLQVVRLELATGRVQARSFGPAATGNAEFPRVDPRRESRSDTAPRWLVTAGGWRGEALRQGAPRHGVQLHHLGSGQVRRFDYGEHQVAEEHVVVPKPGRRGELDAWLLGTTYDARRRSTVLNLLDAARLEDGPVAQAVLPYMLPLGFHGNFYAA